MLKIAVFAAIALLAGAGPGDYVSDVTLFEQQLSAFHPHFDNVAFAAAAAELKAALPSMTEEQADVGFMKLVASLGDRNGHSGIYPLDPGNHRVFHEYPFLVYEFADGVYVTGEIGGSDLVGARLTAVGGVPIGTVLAQVAPLVPHDNRMTGIKLFRAMYLLNEEVLLGLGIAPTFSFVLPDGTPTVVAPAAVDAETFRQALDGLGLPMWPHGPDYAADRAAEVRLSLRAHGRVAYLAYNVTTVRTYGLAARLLRLGSRPAVRRIVVDLRNNGGGDNHTYPPLIDALQRLGAKHKKIVVLAGRSTFSAAVNFMGDLERATRYLLVGEDSGGAPNLYGDTVPLDLPLSGLRVDIATLWWVKSVLGASDPRVTFQPDVFVRPTAEAWFAGRDPALSAAFTAPAAKAHRIH